MILDPENLTIMETKLEGGYTTKMYAYFIESNDGKKFSINMSLDKAEGYSKIFVAKQSMDDARELLVNKEFPSTAQGFIEATDLFEQLIREQQQENEGNDGSDGNPLPPIGFLFPDEIFWELKMQDGRKAMIRSGIEFNIQNNVFSFIDTRPPFSQDEKFFVDVYNEEKNILALYPYSDTQPKDGGNGDGKGQPQNQKSLKPSKQINEGDVDKMSKGEKPYSKEQGEKGKPDDKGKGKDGEDGEDEGKVDPKDLKKPDEKTTGGLKGGNDQMGDFGGNEDDDFRGGQKEEKGDGEPTPTDEKTIKEKLANLYGFDYYKDLVMFFGSEDLLIADLYELAPFEKPSFARTLGMEEKIDTLAEDLEKIIKG